MHKYQSLVDDAFAPVEEFFTQNADSRMDIKNHPYYETTETVGTGTRLRADSELSYDALRDTTDNFGKVITTPAKNDIAYLIEHGDLMTTGDPLLSAMDGAIKRGKEPVRVVVKSAQLIAEDKPKKKSVEYTTFINLVVDWE